MLEGSRVGLRILTGTTPPPERKEILRGLADGTVDLVIGTHALLTETVRFKSLAVAVIDEQHRFGVHQRATLRTKGTGAPGDRDTLSPHVLVMTATPIPRTLAITLFGDLDISTIDALPPVRRPVTTKVVGPEQRRVVYDWLLEKVQKGQQAFIVGPTIGPDTWEEESQTQVASVRSLAKELEAGPLKGLRLAMLHGRLKSETREAIMTRFRKGEIDVLIATTVIEVGVDVPNATVMVVEHADRFGLAQLHQLRGRIGRGTKDSVCVLIGEPQNDEARQRLEVMAGTSDGFALAEKDFEIRGFGEVLGTRQAGLPPFKVAQLPRDRELLAMARRDASEWIEKSPSLDRPDEALLRRRLWKTYGESLGLADIG
jgi:ATP-dependent DNA helicase RecG